MKKLIAMFALLMITIVSVSATTEIRSEVFSNAGMTDYREVTRIGGQDWSEGAATTDPSDYNHAGPTPKYTANILFGVQNDRTVDINTYVFTPGPWNMVKHEAVSGEGNSAIFKDLVAWTEDKKIGKDGKLVYPTEAWVVTEFSTPSPFYDKEEAHFIMDKPQAKDDVFGEPGNFGYFSKRIDTDEPFNFEGSEGINMDCCQFEMPQPPQPTEPICATI